MTGDGTLFIDTGYSQCCHYAEKACGDAVALKRIAAEERLLAVLADGLGHGLKASILALMTTTMAIRFSEADREILHSAEIIMDALPVCQLRKISYATFTIIDTRLNGMTKVIEMGNPPFILLRDGKTIPVKGREIASPKYRDRAMTVYTFEAKPYDRLIFCSDGVTQAGMGSIAYPLGWRDAALRSYVEELVSGQPEISARELSDAILREAIAHETGLKPMDDITAGCFYFRPPHQLLLFTGPPFDRAKDQEAAAIFADFDGTKVISGGTTAEIIARELGKSLETDLASATGKIPPMSRMDGANLVTEGIFTLSQAAKYLEENRTNVPDPAGKLADLLLDHDIIHFLVGTRINEAHQDPNLPIELELRRNIIKRLGEILQTHYAKEISIKFI